MNHRYYNPKKNKTPEQRKKYREYVESAAASDTIASKEVLEYDSTDKDLKNRDYDSEMQPLSNAQIGFGFAVHPKGIWRTLLTILGALAILIPIIVFYSNQSSKITANETNINSIYKELEDQSAVIKENKSELIEYIDKQITNFKTDFYNFFNKD